MAQAQKQKRVHWSKDEDEKLTNYVKIHGESRKTIWKHVSEGAGLQRNGKSCRLRWMNFLSPKINKEPLSEDEEATIIKLHEKHGNKWTYIARKLEGRADTKVKNFWKRYSKKKLPQKETPGLVAQTPLLGQSFATADIFSCALNDPRDNVLKLHSDASFTGNRQDGHGFQQLEVNDETASFMDELLSIPTGPVSALPESSMANQELYGQLEGFGMYETSPMSYMANQELYGQLDGFGMYETDYFFDLDSFMDELPSIPTAPVQLRP